MNIFHVQFCLSVGLVGLCGYMAAENIGMIFPAFFAAIASYLAAKNSIKFGELHD